MPAHPPIQYLQNHQLDRSAWDACIDRAPNGVLYAYSWYLDAMCTSWDALVLRNYEAVFPLPYRSKWGIHYLYQPFLTAQLGLFGEGITKDLLLQFLNTIPPKFKYWDFPLNHGNLFTLETYPLYQRMNYVLDLNKPYEELYAHFRDNTKRNIKQSQPYNLQVKKHIPLEDVIRLNKEQSLRQQQSFTDTDYNGFRSLFTTLKDMGRAITYGVYSAQNELMASVAFLYAHNRAYYLLVGNHPNSRALGASHRLIDAFIQDHAPQHLLLDFEGSDISSLAFFYSSFGASPEPFSAITLNRLPWYLKWLKN